MSRKRSRAVVFGDAEDVRRGGDDEDRSAAPTERNSSRQQRQRPSADKKKKNSSTVDDFYQNVMGIGEEQDHGSSNLTPERPMSTATPAHAGAEGKSLASSRNSNTMDDNDAATTPHQFFQRDGPLSAKRRFHENRGIRNRGVGRHSRDMRMLFGNAKKAGRRIPVKEIPDDELKWSEAVDIRYEEGRQYRLLRHRWEKKRYHLSTSADNTSTTEFKADGDAHGNVEDVGGAVLAAARRVALLTPDRVLKEPDFQVIRKRRSLALKRRAESNLSDEVLHEEYEGLPETIHSSSLHASGNATETSNEGTSGPSSRIQEESNTKLFSSGDVVTSSAGGTSEPPMSQLSWSASSRTSQPHNNTADDDSSSEEERKQQLGSLWTMTQESEAEEIARQRLLERKRMGFDDKAIEWEERATRKPVDLARQRLEQYKTLNYEQLGYTAPTYPMMKGLFNYSVEKLQFHQREISEEEPFPLPEVPTTEQLRQKVAQRRRRSGKAPPSFAVAPSTTRSQPYEPSVYYPIQWGPKRRFQTIANGRFFHKRAAMKIALERGAQMSDADQDKLIRVLLTENREESYECSDEYIRRMLTFHRGENVSIFRRYYWTTPASLPGEPKEGERASIYAENDDDDIADFFLTDNSILGYSLDPGRFARRAMKERKKVIRQYAMDHPTDPDKKKTIPLTYSIAAQQRYAKQLYDKDKQEKAAKTHDADDDSSSEDDENANDDITNHPAVRNMQYTVDPTEHYRDFEFRPGAIPPVPPFPLTRDGFIFGKADRWAKAWRSHKVDDGVHFAIWRMLTARLKRDQRAVAEAVTNPTIDEGAGFSGPGSDNDEDREPDGNSKNTSSATSRTMSLDEATSKLKRTEQLFQRYFDELKTVNGRDPTVGVSMRGRATSVPMVALKRAIESEMEYIVHHKRKKSDADHADAREIAWDLTLLFEGYERHQGLRYFPKLFIPYALAIVAKEVPDTVAKMLVGPLLRHDSVGNEESPVERIRTLLERLESDRLLKSSGARKNQVNATILENFFLEAATKLEFVLDSDRDNVDVPFWHLAFLLGCVMLSSGNKIGKDIGAHVLPSSKGANAQPYPFEVRPKLNGMKGVWLKSRKALYNLLMKGRQTEYKSFSRLHMHIIKTLEWTQMMALLIGPRRKKKESLATKCKCIRKEHLHHVIQWTHDDASTQSFIARKYLVERGDLPNIHLQETAALGVENRPADLCKWRALVHSLGPVAQHQSCKEERESMLCNQEACSSCSFLHQDFRMNHRICASKDWWGRDRTYFLDEYMVVPPAENNDTNANLSNLRHALPDVESLAKPSSSSKKEHKSRHSTEDTGDLSLDERNDLDWLRTEDFVDDKKFQDWMERDRYRDYKSKLPVTPPSLEQAIPPLHSSITNEDVELLCCKVVVACHLTSGTSHESVHKLVLELAQRAVKKREADDLSEDDDDDDDGDQTEPVKEPTYHMDEYSDEWETLTWLSSYHGLNVARILTLALEQDSLKGSN